jgi:sulfonate transport system ATP-binding protein
MIGLKIERLYKSFVVDDSEVRVLDGVSLDIGNGEFISIVGRSGCGKSTILRIIAGLTSCTSGTVELDGKMITAPGLERGMVFQDHRLLPWLTVKQNIEFGLYSLTAEQRERVVSEHISLVSLTGFETAFPGQLSGGMAQRAAIARALVRRPQILLLDEPFGALDALTRIQLQQEILKIWEAEKTSMILVTHDIDEAIYLSDRVIVLSNRPAKIQKILEVELPRPRDRNSYDFSLLRKQIYKEFFADGNGGELLEYYI